MGKVKFLTTYLSAGCWHDFWLLKLKQPPKTGTVMNKRSLLLRQSRILDRITRQNPDVKPKNGKEQNIGPSVDSESWRMQSGEGTLQAWGSWSRSGGQPSLVSFCWPTFTFIRDRCGFSLMKGNNNVFNFSKQRSSPKLSESPTSWVQTYVP